MLKKRILSFLLCLALAASLGFTALADDDGFVPVASAEDLALLREDPSGSYRLTADLDMAGVDWEPLAFRGRLDGNGHTIFNLTVTRTGAEQLETIDGNYEKYKKGFETVFAGLFSSLIDARVENLTLRGVDVTIDTQADCYASALTGYMSGSVVSGCTVTDTRISLTSRCTTAQNGVACVGGVAGIAGFGCGTVEDCTVSDTVLVFDDQCADGLKVEQFLGGVLANGYMLLKNCSVTMEGYAACNGYAHNGGLIGMSYQYQGSTGTGAIQSCSITGAIHFYENNGDRRAYCEAYIGEPLTWTAISEDCVPSFTRDETDDYTARMAPEQCDAPSLTETVTEPDCDHWGYTEHTCTVCGNHWRDSFTAPPHQPGDWVVTKEATYEESGERSRFCTLCGAVLQTEIIAPHVAGEWITAVEPGFNQPGERQRLCTDCGQVLETEVIPALIPVSWIVSEPASMELTSGDSGKIVFHLEPADAYNPVVYWTSSDKSVATVDTNGTVHAVGKGTAVITGESADGFARTECAVTVNYTWKQWVTHYILFGWLWDN